MRKRVRQGARILVLTPDKRFLMLRHVYSDGPLAGTDYWGLPGGGVDAGETPEEGARRELFEETGLRAASLGLPVGKAEYALRLMSGEEVLQRDDYFIFPVAGEVPLSKAHYTAEELLHMTEAGWWSLDDLRGYGGMVVPADAARLIEGLIFGRRE